MMALMRQFAFLLLLALFSITPSGPLAAQTASSQIFTVQADRQQLPQSAEAANIVMAKSAQILQIRLTKMGGRTVSVQRLGADQLSVTLSAKDPEKLLTAALQGRGALSFHLVNEQLSAEDIEAGKAPTGSILLPMADGYSKLAIRQAGALSGKYIVRAQRTFTQGDNMPAVDILLDDEGRQKFGKMTHANVGKLIAVVLDGKILTAPRINEPILGGMLQISGRLSLREADELAAKLASGSLPVDFSIVAKRNDQ
ncbi:preprotein translocase subunit SecD [Sphingorhabdus arenilitoris]|uniref:Preprotein translocase subunit SecD n=2 Tax=Sphingorhabdus arenilitoris TaxID=1490041 RepID=A0ABV8RHD7_9SPHN